MSFIHHDKHRVEEQGNRGRRDEVAYRKFFDTFDVLSSFAFP